MSACPSHHQPGHQAAHQEEAEAEGDGGGGVTEVALAETHVHLQGNEELVREIRVSFRLNGNVRQVRHLLVSELDEGAALLVVARRPLHALSLRGDAVVVVSEVLVQPLHYLMRNIMKSW